jgi:hypothetical protein
VKKEVHVGLLDNGLTSAGAGLLVILGTMAAAPIVLPALAGIARPLAKAAIRFSFEVADDIRDVVAHHQPRRHQTPGLVHHLLCGGTEELVTQGLEVGAEDSVAETVAAVVAEIL